MDRDVSSLMANPTVVDGGAITAGTGQAHATINSSILSSWDPSPNHYGEAAGRNTVNRYKHVQPLKPFPATNFIYYKWGGEYTLFCH